MSNTLLLFAEIMPEDMIIDEIENTAKEYKITGDPEVRKKLTMFCALFAAKQANNEFGLEKNMKDMDEMKSIRERMNFMNK